MSNQDLKKIRKEIEESMEKRLGEDFKNVIDRVTRQLFTGKTHFIMEILQNTEDALRKKGEKDGVLKFFLSPERIKIEHNGKIFDYVDVDSICGVRSKKDPKEDYIGYMGIGFKSVFAITNNAQIFSGGYHFKFDKDNCPNMLPWFITPLEAKPSERINEKMTTFIFPFKPGENIYQETKAELKKFGSNLLMFLKWVKKIEIHFEDEEESSKQLDLENIGAKDGRHRFLENRTMKEFVVFKKTLEVTPDVRNDPETFNAERHQIKKREVIIAFPLDEEGNIEPWSQKDRSVYSFLPMENARSGYPFIIQADFIVEPGRRNLALDTLWNRWLVEGIGDLVKEAIKCFQENSLWRKNYLILFKVEKREDDKVFMTLFEPHLCTPIQKYLKEPKVPDIKNELISITKAVKALPHGEIVDLLSSKDLDIYFGEEGCRFMDLGVQLREEEEKKIKRISLLDIAKSKDVLEEKKENVDWFKKLYKMIYNHRSDISYSDLSDIYILSENNDLVKAGKIYFNELPDEIEELKKKSADVRENLSEYPFLKSELEHEFKESGESDSSNEFKEFLEEHNIVKRISYETICRDVFLPLLSTDNDKPKTEAANKIVEYTVFIKNAKIIDKKIWVLTKKDGFTKSDEIFLSSEYSETEIMDKHKEILTFDFISQRYLDYGDNDDWYNFFKELGVITSSEYANHTARILNGIRTEVAGKEISKPGKDDLIIKTRLIRKYSENKETDQSGTIWVVTKPEGGTEEIIQSNKGVFFGSVYKPEQDWEKNKQYIQQFGGTDTRFLSEDYLQDKESIKEKDEWRDFFSQFKVKEKSDQTEDGGRIGIFAEQYVEEILKDRFEEIKNVRKENRGYDLECKRKDGGTVYIEVKGRIKKTEELADDAVKLTAPESSFAKHSGNYYFACIVTSIPEEPRLYLLQNPRDNGITPEIALPKDKWKAYDKNFEI